MSLRLHRGSSARMARRPAAILGPVHVPSTFLFLVELLVEMKPFEQELGGGGHQARAFERTEREDAFA